MDGKRFFQLVLIAVLVPLTACASINAPVDGVVIDESTGKPIAGAFVIAQWVRQGADMVGSRTSCPHLEVVQSDDRGLYRLPEANVGLMGATRLVFPYKAGYEQVFKDEESNARLMTIRPYPGNGDDRLPALMKYESLKDCGSAKEVVPKLRGLFTALDGEIRELRLSNMKFPDFGLVNALDDLARYIDGPIKRGSGK